MKSRIFLLLAMLFAVSCNKELLETPVVSERNTLSFNDSVELSDYAEALKNGHAEPLTKSSSNETGFVSLWDYSIKQFMASVQPELMKEMESEGLSYEPEDELIPDPIFAKIVNYKREVTVATTTYRYVTNGVIKYDCEIDTEEIDAIDLSSFNNLEDGTQVQIKDGIVFQAISYENPVNDDLLTKAPTIPGTNVGVGGLTLKGGINIPADKLERISYEQSSSDANGFQRAISSIFGKNVVAINNFDDKHRMKLRTFSQDYVIYRSVGMTVRMQKKTAGVWFRIKAQEFRYGWTAVECEYKYTGNVFPAGINLNEANPMSKTMEYYEKPLVLFTVPFVDFAVTNKDVLSVMKTALSKNKSKIDRWLNNNPEYKSNPQSIYSTTTQKGYHVFYPQYEDSATNDGREQVNWDFTFKGGLLLTIGDGGFSAAPLFVTLDKVTINRGETYAAVKYDDEWRACVISTK